MPSENDLEQPLAAALEPPTVPTPIAVKAAWETRALAAAAEDERKKELERVELERAILPEIHRAIAWFAVELMKGNQNPSQRLPTLVAQGVAQRFKAQGWVVNTQPVLTATPEVSQKFGVSIHRPMEGELHLSLQMPPRV